MKLLANPMSGAETREDFKKEAACERLFYLMRSRRFLAKWPCRIRAWGISKSRQGRETRIRGELIELLTLMGLMANKKKEVRIFLKA